LDRWKNLHGELSNKIRWAICTSLLSGGVNISYPDGSNWAGQIASDVLEGAKLMDEKPDYRPWIRTKIDTEIEHILTQKKI